MFNFFKKIFNQDQNISNQVSLTNDLSEKSFSNIKDQLRCNLYSDEQLANLQIKSLVTKKVFSDLHAVLMIDDGDALESVSQGMIKKWGKTGEELINQAIKNHKRLEYKFEKMWADKDNNVAITTISNLDNNASTTILFLEQFSELISSHGALVVLPSREVAFVYPISDLNVTTMVDKLALMATEIYQETDKPVTEKLFWWNNGKVIDLPYQFTKDKFKFFPPQVFMNMINQLAKQQL